MIQIVICAVCKLRYGKYWTFHKYPEYVEMERKRHNCRLIHQCKEWMAVNKQWFYADPKCRGEDDGPPADVEERGMLVDAEERVIEAKAVFRVRLNAYEDAEARACSRVFAAALADETVRDMRAHADAAEAGYRDAVAAHGRAATARGHCRPDAPRRCRRDDGVPAGDAAVVATGERVRRTAALRRAAVEATAAAVARASVAHRAAHRAREAVGDRGRALVRAMDELAAHAARSGVRLTVLGPGDPDGDGRIEFLDHQDPYYDVYDLRDEDQDVDHGSDDVYGSREP